MKRACLIFALLPALAGAQSLRLDGEVFARSSEQVAPPSIPNVWNLNITEFAPDGVPLKPGDMVVVFDGGETQNQLVTVRSQLAEKQSQREQLLLELAERERNEHLATEERRAKLDKAQRKATQPESLVRRVDYKKLVIERAEAEELMALIPAPDFPTGGILLKTDELKNAYTTGKGKLLLRARTHVEDGPAGRKLIVISEIP